MCFCKTVCTTHVQLVSEESPGKSLSKLPELMSLPVSSIVEKTWLWVLTVTEILMSLTEIFYEKLDIILMGQPWNYNKISELKISVN